MAVGSVGVFRHATFALKYWTDFSLKFVEYLHTKFQYLSAAMLQLNIGKPLEINAYQSKISVQRDTRSFDSLSLSVNFSLGWRLYMERQYDQAISQLLNTIEMDPTYLLAHIVLGQLRTRGKVF